MTYHLSSKLTDLGLNTSLLLLTGKLARAVLLALGLPLLLGLLGAGLLVLLEGVLTNGLVGLEVGVLKVTSIDLVLDVLDELRAVALLIIISEGLHVLSNVATEDVAAESLGVELLGLNIVTGEAVLGVGDEDTTIGGTLHGTEDTGTGGGADKTNIKEGLEGTAGALVGLDGLSELVFTVSLLDTSELLVKAELLEGTAGKEETGGVGGSPVGQTLGDTIALELVRVSGGEDLVTRDLRVDDLSDDVAVGEANNQTVLGRIVLVLGLGDEALTGVVVGLTLTATAVLGLVAAVTVSFGFPGFKNKKKIFLEKDSPEVRAVLDGLVEGLFHTIRVSNLRFRSPVRSILQRPVSSPQKLMGERKQMHFCMADNDSIVRDEYKTHHFDGCWRYVDVGCGKKKRRVGEFRGLALWGTSLSTGCIRA